jgi:hypothetical protein
MVGFRREERQSRRRADEQFRLRRRLLVEDVAALARQLAALDASLGEDHGRAVSSCESARSALADVTDVDGLGPVESAVTEGRYRLACVLASQDGLPLPAQLPECFFNPQHGPSSTDVAWTSTEGDERRVPACGADAERLANDERPDIRTVRVGERMVPWFDAEKHTETARTRTKIDYRAITQARKETMWVSGEKFEKNNSREY